LGGSYVGMVVEDFFEDFSMLELEIAAAIVVKSPSYM
jgi:hypothetical protein